MSDFYKILKADPLGDPWESHGKENQSYWCQVEGQDKAVSISKQVPNTLTPGQHVYGDLVYAKSQKGTEYWKFKTAMVPEGVQRPADDIQPEMQSYHAQQYAPSHAPNIGGQVVPAWFVPVANQINDIHKMLSDQGAATYSDVKAILDEPIDKPKDYVPEDEAPDPRVAFGE